MTGGPPLERWLRAAAPAAGRGALQGLERAVVAGDVAGADDLAGWLADMLRMGSGRSEALLLSGALQGGDPEALTDLARALARAASDAPSAAAAAPAAAADPGAAPPDPCWPGSVAAGIAARQLGLAPQQVVETYLGAIADDAVAAAARLLPMEPDGAQAVLGALRPVIAGVAAEVLAMSPEAIARLATAAAPGSTAEAQPHPP